MQHALDGARLKIVRAQEHLDALKSEVVAYLDKEPYEIIGKDDGEQWSFEPRIQFEPPVHLSLIIGDVVTNARAALDYIAWELAVRYLQNPVFGPDDYRWTKFPLADDPTSSGFINHINRLTNRTAPHDAIDQIRAVQPYNSGYKSLWWLHELVNTDKHRMPLLTVGVTTASHIEIIFKETPIAFFQGGITRASVASRSFPHGTTGKDVKMHAQLAGYVTFSDSAMPRGPVDRTLEQIVKTVTDVIPRFDPFF